MHPRHLLLALALAVLTAMPAAATFHFMQIEQVSGAACGDVSQQAIQLRMRSGGQNLVAASRVLVHDAAGTNPVLVLDLTSNVANGSAGDRVLLVTAEFAAANGITPDFTVSSPIPASYLDAGRLTFEDDFGTIYWSLAWGGSNYTGSNLGATDNDVDGNFGPPFGDPLLSPTGQAVLFSGSAAALSTTNAADYAYTTGPPVFTNNAGTGVTLPDCVFGDGFESGDISLWSTVVP